MKLMKLSRKVTKDMSVDKPIMKVGNLFYIKKEKKFFVLVDDILKALNISYDEGLEIKKQIPQATIHKLYNKKKFVGILADLRLLLDIINKEI